MMQMRARAFALRDGFADVLKGMAIAEEVQDYVDLTPLLVPETQKTLGELSVATSSVGITLTFDNGIAVASGNTRANAKLLKGLGFTVSGSTWVCPCIDDRPKEVEAKVETKAEKPMTAKAETREITDLADLGVALQELGLEIELKESGEKTYAGAKGGWGRDVSELIQQPAQTKEEEESALEKEAASLF
jgi:hypothetical protein